jgi:hypothetical protein
MALLRGLIDAVRKLPLKHSTYHGALQLAVLARGPYGEVQISYDRLAKMTHYSIRTAFRIIARLEHLGIIEAIREPLGDRLHATNVYRFVIFWDKQTPARLWGSAKKSIGAFFGPRSGKMTSIAEKKDQTKDPIVELKENIARREKGLRLFPPPTAEGRQACEEEIARLKALLPPEEPAHA